ncbi:MAG: DUF58 domain-containing protein [Elusimicrobia bacterium]|nr:DUF58 domain-containing protein [Elusimicrobiota bacterium]
MDRLRYWFLRHGTGVLHGARRRLTPGGWLALACLIGSAALGIDTNQSMAYQAFCLVIELFALSCAAALAWRPRFSAARRLPRFGTAGVPLPYTATVRNEGRKVLRETVLLDEAADPRPDFAQFSAAKTMPGDNPLERLFGAARWRRLLGPRLHESQAGRPVPDLVGGAAVDAALTLVPHKRGVLRLEALTLGRPDPLGLVNGLARRSLPQSVVILPKRYPVPRLDLPGARRHQPGGVSQASRIGDSQEFMSLRDYRPGDPLRRVHWRSWAKTGEPVVKEYQDEFFTRHALILDTFAPPGGSAAFEEAVSVAASFACTLLTQESLLDLLFLEKDVVRVTAGRGQGGVSGMLEVLACAQPSARPFADLRISVSRRRETLSACLVVLLAVDEERRALLAELRGAGIPVLAAVVAGPESVSDAVCAAQGLRRLEPGRIEHGLAALGDFT